MRSCREITALISESLDRRLSWRERAAMRLHLVMCLFCRRFRRQMTFIREAVRYYVYEIEPAGARPAAGLSPEARQRILEAIETYSKR